MSSCSAHSTSACPLLWWTYGHSKTHVHSSIVHVVDQTTKLVLGIEDLLCELWDCQCTVLLGSTRGQWCVTSLVEMKAWEWDQIHSILAEISFRLPRKTEARCHNADAGIHQVVEISVSWSGGLLCADLHLVGMSETQYPSSAALTDKHVSLCFADLVMVNPAPHLVMMSVMQLLSIFLVTDHSCICFCSICYFPLGIFLVDLISLLIWQLGTQVPSAALGSDALDVVFDLISDDLVRGHPVRCTW